MVYSQPPPKTARATDLPKPAVAIIPADETTDGKVHVIWALHGDLKEAVRNGQYKKFSNNALGWMQAEGLKAVKLKQLQILASAQNAIRHQVSRLPGGHIQTISPKTPRLR